MARKEKELHLQLYPGWSARDNYATHTKNRKRKRETATTAAGVTELWSSSSPEIEMISIRDVGLRHKYDMDERGILLLQ